MLGGPATIVISPLVCDVPIRMFLHEDFDVLHHDGFLDGPCYEEDRSGLLTARTLPQWL